MEYRVFSNTVQGDASDQLRITPGGYHRRFFAIKDIPGNACDRFTDETHGSEQQSDPDPD